MHRSRRKELIDLAPVISLSRSSSTVRVLRTEEELEAAQERARAFERRDAELYQRLQPYCELAIVLPLEQAPEVRLTRPLGQQWAERA